MRRRVQKARIARPVVEVDAVRGEDDQDVGDHLKEIVEEVLLTVRVQNGPAKFRDVLRGALHPDDAAVLDHGEARDADPLLYAGRGDDFELAGKGALSGDRRPVRLAQALPVLPLEHLEVPLHGEGRRRLELTDPRQLLAPLHHPRRRLDPPGADLGQTACDREKFVPAPALEEKRVVFAAHDIASVSRPPSGGVSGRKRTVPPRRRRRYRGRSAVLSAP